MTVDQGGEHTKPVPQKPIASRKDGWLALVRFVPASLYALCIGFFCVGFTRDEPAPRASMTEYKKLRVLNQSGTAYREWDQDAVVAFGIAQTASSINYMMLSAAALLGFVGKMLVDPLVKADVQLPSTYTRILFSWSAFGCVLSLVAGSLATGYFPLITVHKTFSIYGSVGTCHLFQLIFFGIAGVSFLTGVLCEQCHVASKMPAAPRV